MRACLCYWFRRGFWGGFRMLRVFPGASEVYATSATVVLIFLAAALCCRAAEPAPPVNLGFRVPEGFEVTLYADDDLAHDIYSMTIDSHGRVAVAGRGYVKLLHDDNADGKADRATLFSDRPKSGAHGMYFDGDDLICTGDDSLMKLRDVTPLLEALERLQGRDQPDEGFDLLFEVKPPGQAPVTKTQRLRFRYSERQNGEPVLPMIGITFLESADVGR